MQDPEVRFCYAFRGENPLKNIMGETLLQRRSPKGSDTAALGTPWSAKSKLHALKRKSRQGYQAMADLVSIMARKNDSSSRFSNEVPRDLAVESTFTDLAKQLGKILSWTTAAVHFISRI